MMTKMIKCRHVLLVLADNQKYLQSKIGRPIEAKTDAVSDHQVYKANSI